MRAIWLSTRAAWAAALLAVCLPCTALAEGPLGLHGAATEAAPNGTTVVFCGLTVGAAAQACALPAPPSEAEVAGVQLVPDTALLPKLTVQVVQEITTEGGLPSFLGVVNVPAIEFAAYVAGPLIPQSGWPTFGRLIKGSADGMPQLVTIDVAPDVSLQVMLSRLPIAGGGPPAADEADVMTRAQVGPPSEAGEIAVIAAPLGPDTLLYVNAPALIGALGGAPVP